MKNAMNILDELVSRYPVLLSIRKSIEGAYLSLRDCYENKGTLLICGNGGSSADSAHIVGELMKGFLSKREISSDFKHLLSSLGGDRGISMSGRLQKALPAISLGAHQSLISAVSNDIGSDLVYAQQVLGYGSKGDVLLGISTSGNAENVINAMIVAKASGLTVIGLTGVSGGQMKSFCDITIQVPESSVPVIQELHLPVYHALCAMLEAYFFD